MSLFLTDRLYITSQLLIHPAEDVDEIFACYNRTITAILDKLVPYVDIWRFACKVSPWYDHDCYITKLWTYRLHRAYRRSADHASLVARRSQLNVSEKCFRPVTMDEIVTMIGKVPAKQHLLDPLLTLLLKRVTDMLSPVTALMWSVWCPFCCILAFYIQHCNKMNFRWASRIS